VNFDQFIAACVGDSLEAYDPTGLRLVLEVQDAVPKSLNAFMGRSRWAWRGEKTKWIGRLSKAWWVAKAEQGRAAVAWPTPPTRKVRVTVERITPRANALDADNLAGSCKPLLDALRHLQLLADDTTEAIDLVVRQPKGEPKQKLTRITLELV
jgi:hypothetical protein